MKRPDRRLQRSVVAFVVRLSILCLLLTVAPLSAKQPTIALSSTVPTLHGSLSGAVESFQAVVLPNFKLPYDRNINVFWTGGPHGYNQGGQLTGKYLSGEGTGLDFSNGTNFEVLAMASGQVIEADCTGNGTFGCQVAIQHDVGGTVMVYAHLMQNSFTSFVASGHVNQGDVLARAGNTGGQTSVHLHIELRRGNDDGSQSFVCWLQCLPNNLGGMPLGWDDGLPLVDGYSIFGFIEDAEGLNSFNYEGSAVKGQANIIWNFPYKDSAINERAIVRVSQDFACDTTGITCENNTFTANTQFGNHGCFGQFINGQCVPGNMQGASAVAQSNAVGSLLSTNQARRDDPLPPPNDTTPPTALWIIPSNGQTISSSAFTLSVNASDNSEGSGVRIVNFSAKINGAWRGVGSDTSAPYNINWNWCASGASNGIIELGIEVWDNANNKWVYSEHYTNISVNKSYICPQDPEPPPPPDAGVYIYDQTGYNGNGARVTGDTPSLGAYGWNDRIESIRTFGNYHYALFGDDNFSGSTLAGNGSSDLGSWRRQPSSIRIRRSENPAFTVYSLGDFNGETWASDRTIYDMNHWGKNDWAESIRINSGFGIVACEHGDFHGNCGRATGPGQFSDLNALSQGLRRGLSSVRVCVGSCPPAAGNSTLYYPINAQEVSSSADVILRWSGGGFEYNVQLEGGALGSMRTFGWTTENNWNVGRLPESDQPYTWRVRASNGFGDSGWVTMTFYVRPPTVKVTDAFTTDAGGVNGGLAGPSSPVGIYTPDVDLDTVDTSFAVGDPISLFMYVENNTGTSQTAHFKWTVIDSIGRLVPALSWEGDLITPTGTIFWLLSNSIPSDVLTGTYAYHAEIQYGSRTTTETSTFYVTGNPAVHALGVYTADDVSGSQPSHEALSERQQENGAVAGIRSVFTVGESIELHFIVYNNATTPVDAYFVWEVRDPLGTLVNAFRYNGILNTFAGYADWRITPAIPLNLIEGTYLFTGYVTFQGTTHVAATSFTIGGVPVNDIRANATSISSLTWNASQDVYRSTVSVDDPVMCRTVSNTVWFKYLPQDDEYLYINTFESTYDTVLGVYIDNILGLAELACVDDSDGTVQSKTRVYVAGGETVYIGVANYGASPIVAQQTLQLSVDSVSPVDLSVNVDLQGRPTSPHARWSVPLHIIVNSLADGTVFMDTSLPTNQYGTVLLPPIPPGSYVIWVKHSHTLASALEVTVTADSQISLPMLREGDANNNNIITVTDFSVLASTFGKTVGQSGYDARADFNEDGSVTISDFSLLASNFGQTGVSP